MSRRYAISLREGRAVSDWLTTHIGDCRVVLDTLLPLGLTA
jgi:hypothetical protein